MKKFFSTRNLKSIVGVVLVIALVIGIIALFASIFGSKTKRISSSSFAVGGLDVAGQYRESTKCLYSKDAFCCQGLSIEKVFESKSRYEVYYYREDNSFIGKTDMLTDHSYEKGNSFSNAMFARIVITPVLDADENLNILNKGSYANEFNITVLKDQSFTAPTLHIMPDVQKDFATEISDSSYRLVMRSDAPFAYQDLESFSGKTVKQISVPIGGVVDTYEESKFTVWVVEGDGTEAFKQISKHELVIPAFTFTSSLGEVDEAANEIESESSVNWFSWDVNITVKENQTLAFGSSDDTAYFVYRRGAYGHEQYEIYNTVFTASNAVPVAIYVDVTVLE